MSAEFGNRTGKPPDRGKPPARDSGERDEPLAKPGPDAQGSVGGPGHASAGKGAPEPRPFAGAEPAAAQGSPLGEGGGGRKLPYLRPVGSPEPPNDGPPPPTKEGAEIERQRVETDTIRARNEAIRSEAIIKEKKAASEIQIAENRAEVEDEAVEVDTETTRTERIFFMWMIALGVLITAISSVIAGLAGQPLFFTGSGVGLLAAGGGLRRLGVLTSPRRRKACLLGRRSQEDAGERLGK
jgi:hypothetical protein